MTLKVGRMVVFTALATAARQVLACRRSLSTPQSYAFFLDSLLFSMFFLSEKGRIVLFKIVNDGE